MCYLSFDLKTGVARLRCLRNQQTPENNGNNVDDDDDNDGGDGDDNDDDDDDNYNDGDNDNDNCDDNDEDNRNDIDADDNDIDINHDNCLEISPVWCLLASVAPWVENLIPKAAKDKKNRSMVTFDIVQFCTCGKRCTMSVCAFCS